MSCLPIASTTASYAAALIQAENSFDESEALLCLALRGKTVEGSIAQQIDQLDVQTKLMNETPRNSENFAPVKEQFFHFMEAQLSKFETSQKAHAEGIKALVKIKNAKEICAVFKPDPVQEEALKHYMKRLGVNIVHYEEEQAKVKSKTVQYPFDKQIAKLIAKLSDAVAKIAAQMIILEIALDRAFFAKKRAEGNMRVTNLSSYYDNPYLLEALEEATISSGKATKAK